EKYFAKNNIEFSKKFNRYGTARWVWATVRQHASASETYRIFENTVSIYQPKVNMKKLLFYPNNKVKISSLLYVICPYLYYKLIRKINIKRGETVRLDS